MPVSKRRRSTLAAGIASLLGDGYTPLTIGEKAYIVWRVGTDYVMRPEGSDAVPYVVTRLNCTCQDRRVRARVCKHMRAVAELERGQRAAAMRREAEEFF